MKNQFEYGPEHTPTREEIMAIITRFVESPEKLAIIRELSDQEGVTLLDMRIEGEKPGETTEYLYQRKGIMPNGVMTSWTSIEVSYYEDGQIVNGKRIAVYNYENSEWNDA